MNCIGTRGKPISRSMIRDSTWEVRQAIAAEPEALQAASFVTARLLARADAVDDDGSPLFCAWALHAAFLAGARWQKKRQGEK